MERDGNRKFNYYPILGASRLQGVEYGLSLMLYIGSAGQLDTSKHFDYLIPGMQV